MYATPSGSELFSKKRSHGISLFCITFTTSPTRMSRERFWTSSPCWMTSYIRLLNTASRAWRFLSSYPSLTAVRVKARRRGSIVDSGFTGAMMEMNCRRAISRKYWFSGRENCSRKFSGRKVTSVYFEFVTVLSQ
eukprot:gene16999-biopygen17170